MFIANIKVVIQVPRLAPIMIPKQSLGLIYFEDNNEIAIAVVPEEDWINADAIQPVKKLLNLVLTELEIYVFNFVINSFDKVSLI